MKLTNKINRIMTDETLMLEMSKKSLSRIQEYSIENMSNIHIEIFKNIKNSL